MKDEDAYHMMPLHTFASIALHNFMDWVGVEHFTGLVENVPEFHRAPLLKNLVNPYIELYTALYVFQVLLQIYTLLFPMVKRRICDHKPHLLYHGFSRGGEVLFYQCSITLVY